MSTQLRAFAAQLTPTLAALGAMSVLALAIGLERLWTLLRAQRRLHVSRGAILAHLADDMGGKEAGERAAQAVNSSLPAHPATQLLSLVLLASPLAQGELRRAQARTVRNVRRRLWVLGSIGTLSPFVGLMGTVIGIMEAFRAMGAAGAGGFEVVSVGISEALVTTAAGIFVAIEAVLLFNYLQVCVGAYAAQLRDALEEVAELRSGHRRARP